MRRADGGTEDGGWRRYAAGHYIRSRLEEKDRTAVTYRLQQVGDDVFDRRN
jgi:hypothetical protein